MEMTREYPTCKELAITIRDAIDSNSKRIIFLPANRVFEWKELVDFLGRTFEIEKNRRMAFKPGPTGPFSQVIKSTLRENRVQVLKKALLEFNEPEYKHILN
jgi:hypothetical protein